MFGGKKWNFCATFIDVLLVLCCCLLVKLKHAVISLHFFQGHMHRRTAVEFIMQRKLSTSSAGEVRWEDAFLTWRFSPIKVHRLSANKKLMDILDFPENLLSVYHLLNKDWPFRNSEHQRQEIISKKDIHSRWYSPDLLMFNLCYAFTFVLFPTVMALSLWFLLLWFQK